MTNVTTVVCDPHLLFGQAFSTALQRAGARVASVTADPDETLEVVGRQRVEAVALDVGALVSGSLAVIRRIGQEWPQTAVVGLAGRVDRALNTSAIAAGARTVVSKRRPLSDLVDVVLAAARGEPTPSLHAGGAAGAQVEGPQPAGPPRLDDCLVARFLTDRERQVLALLVAGMGTGEIAQRLAISVTTTRGYVQSILVKLGVHSRVEAAAFAVHNSLVTPSAGALRRTELDALVS